MENAIPDLLVKVSGCRETVANHVADVLTALIRKKREQCAEARCQEALEMRLQSCESLQYRTT